MARVYQGVKARVYGAAGGLLMIGTGMGMYVLVGVTAANVPIPTVLERAFHDAAPSLAPAEGLRMSLWMVTLFGVLSLVLVAVGLRTIVEALLTEDYALKIG
jgi:hypothetical protein